MKNKLFALIICLLLLLPAASLAALNPVADNAGLMTESQVSTLTSLCNELSEKYAVDVIIATTNDSQGMTLDNYAADLVDYNDFRTDNIILVIAMDQRKYVCVTTGSCIDAFSDQYLESIYDAMQNNMSAGNYYSACKTYLSRAESALEAWQNGGSSYGWENEDFLDKLKSTAPMCILPGLLIGFIIASVKKKGMNTNRAQQSAGQYRTDMNLTRQRDIYLYTSHVRRRIETNNGGGHGGGGSHRTFSGSSGTRHGGGGGGRSF